MANLSGKWRCKLLICFYILFSGLLMGCGDQDSVPLASEGTEKVSGEEISDEVRWLADCGTSDNTNEHLQNMSQNYQVLQDHILYTDVRSEMEENKKLYVSDRDGKNAKVVLDTVYRFVELDEKIYFSKWGDGELRFQKIYEYDKKNEKTTELEMDDVKIYEFITVQKSKIIVASLNDIYEYDLAEGTVEKILNYPMSTPCKVFADDSRIIFIEDGNIDLIFMDKKKVRRIQKGEGFTDNIGAYMNGIMYMGADCYSLGGVSGRTPFESSQNGLWKMNTVTGEKEKILEKSPARLFLLNGTLYDENLAEVCYIEKKLGKGKK